MNEITPFRYDEYLTVVEANELIRSKQEPLTLLESKLIRLCISQVLKNDTDFRTYQCQLSDLAKYLNMKSSNVCAEIEECVTNIMKKVILIKSKKPNKKGKYNFIAFHWIDTAKYEDGLLTIRLSDELKPYLLGLDKLFAMYQYDALLELPTANSIRVYELLSSYVSIKFSSSPGISKNSEVPVAENEVAFSIAYLRQYLNCEDKYPNAGDFMKRTIEPCVAAINANTLLRISYRKVTKGRAITHIVFKYLSYEEYSQLANNPK